MFFWGYLTKKSPTWVSQLLKSSKQSSWSWFILWSGKMQHFESCRGMRRRKEWGWSPQSNFASSLLTSCPYFFHSRVTLLLALILRNLYLFFENVWLTLPPRNLLKYLHVKHISRWPHFFWPTLKFINFLYCRSFCGLNARVLVNRCVSRWAPCTASFV